MLHRLLLPMRANALQHALQQLLLVPRRQIHRADPHSSAPTVRNRAVQKARAVRQNAVELLDEHAGKNHRRSLRIEDRRRQRRQLLIAVDWVMRSKNNCTVGPHVHVQNEEMGGSDRENGDVAKQIDVEGRIVVADRLHDDHHAGRQVEGFDFRDNRGEKLPLGLERNHEVSLPSL